MVEQHLGFAEEQVARIIQREMEPPDHVGLRLGVEIHERIARHQ
jgi:hypothetical protein